MINTTHLLKVGLSWVTIAYVACFVVVAIYPPLREQFMLYALHTTVDVGSNVTTVTTFVAGLISWNVLAAVGLGLFAWLFNTIKK